MQSFLSLWKLVASSLSPLCSEIPAWFSGMTVEFFLMCFFLMDASNVQFSVAGFYWCWCRYLLLFLPSSSSETQTSCSLDHLDHSDNFLIFFIQLPLLRRCPQFLSFPLSWHFLPPWFQYPRTFICSLNSPLVKHLAFPFVDNRGSLFVNSSLRALTVYFWSCLPTGFCSSLLLVIVWYLS